MAAILAFSDIEKGCRNLPNPNAYLRLVITFLGHVKDFAHICREPSAKQ